MIGLTYSFILLTIVNSLFIFLIPKRRAELFRPLTIFLSLIPLGLCLYVFLNQNLKTSFYVVDKFSWISAYIADSKYTFLISFKVFSINWDCFFI